MRAPFLIVAFVFFTGSGLSEAQLAGTYRLTGTADSATLQVEQIGNGQYRLTRRGALAKGGAESTLTSAAVQPLRRGSNLLVLEAVLGGATGSGTANTLNAAFGGSTSTHDASAITATYRFQVSGGAVTRLGGQLTRNSRYLVLEEWERSATRETHREFRHGGVYLVGQRLPLPVGVRAREVRQGRAKLEQGAVLLTHPGRVRIAVESYGATSSEREAWGDREEVVFLTVVRPEVTAIEVVDPHAIPDAPPPHFQRALREDDEDKFAWEPAAIQIGQALTIDVTLQADRPLSFSTPVDVFAKDDETGRTFRGRGTIQGLRSGATVRMTSDGPWSGVVAAQQVKLEDWTLRVPDGATSDLRPEKTPLRIYTLFGAPRDNAQQIASQGLRYQVGSKLHLELACSWASGGRRNVRSGDDSVVHRFHNQFRHHVHWQDYGRFGHDRPLIPHYPEGIKPPKNYKYLDGAETIRRGVRSPNTGVFYPPLGETGLPYKMYSNYADNYGWWVLDNPNFTGGRCNQQASLIADIAGTLGVEAEVFYVERRGRGKQSGRPLRSYLCQTPAHAHGPLKPGETDRSRHTQWNFHGLAEVTLGNGERYLYDGSFSGPPNRSHGTPGTLLAVPGPIIKVFHAWTYEDVGGRVPQADWPIPSTWIGVPLQPGEVFPGPD